MDYVNSILETIGNTPLLKLNKIGKEAGANIFVKLEYLNPSGSYKDRMALSMVEAAERGETWNGRRLMPGGTVVESSAGNTAPAVAMVCAAKGYKAKIFIYRYYVDNKDTDVRFKITEAYGPEVAVSSKPEKYAVREDLEKLAGQNADLLDILAGKKDCALEEEQNENSIWVDQIYNRANYLGQTAIGEEIYRQLDGRVDAIGCSVSSGASLYGMCLGMEKNNHRPEMVFGVVPVGSEQYIEMGGMEAGLEEVRVSNLRPEIARLMGVDKWTQEESILEHMMNNGYPDKFFCVSNDEAHDMANRLCREEGIYCGMSSGANVSVALRLAKALGPGKNIVTLIVDRRDRYLSEYPNDKYVV